MPEEQSGPKLPPFVLGTLDTINSFSFTITVKNQEGGPSIQRHMDFHRTAQTLVSKGVQSGDRVVVVYKNTQEGQTYDARALLLCPIGQKPEDLVKKLPPTVGEETPR